MRTESEERKKMRTLESFVANYAGVFMPYFEYHKGSDRLVFLFRECSILEKNINSTVSILLDHNQKEGENPFVGIVINCAGSLLDMRIDKNTKISDILYKISLRLPHVVQDVMQFLEDNKLNPPRLYIKTEMS